MALVEEVISRKSTSIINGITTDLVSYGFANRVFIILTQFKRPGTFIHIEKQNAGQNTDLRNTIDISMNVLLGIDDPVYRAYASKIALMVYKNCNKPILLAIALKDKEPSSINEITDMIMKNQVW